MKTLILAAIRCSLMFTAVAALSIAYPTSVQAVPTTYQYTGNPFTSVVAPYTTSDFLTAMVTLAGPLGANMPLTIVTPTAFTLTDGVQTLKQANNLFAYALPVEPQTTPEKKQCQNKNSRYRSKVPTQESDDASGKRPTKAKVLVVHRIGSSALTASA